MAFETRMLSIGGHIAGLSIVLYWVGYYTHYWCKNGSVHSGIWERCDPTGCYTIDPKGPDVYTMDIVQGIEQIAFSCYLLGAFSIFLKNNFLKERKVMYLAIGICNILGAVCNIIGVIIYTTLDSFQRSTINFSFVFMIIASIGGVIGIVILFLGYRRVEPYSEF